MKKKPDGKLSGLGALSLARQPKTAEPDPQPEPTPAPEPARPVGRPKTGKRSNPDYRGVTVYIRKKTNRDIDLWLRQKEDPRDFSDIVQELLDDWWSRRHE